MTFKLEINAFNLKEILISKLIQSWASLNKQTVIVYNKPIVIKLRKCEMLKEWYLNCGNFKRQTYPHDHFITEKNVIQNLY